MGLRVLLIQTRFAWFQRANCCTARASLPSISFELYLPRHGFHFRDGWPNLTFLVVLLEAVRWPATSIWACRVSCVYPPPCDRRACFQGLKGKFEVSPMPWSFQYRTQAHFVVLFLWILVKGAVSSSMWEEEEDWLGVEVAHQRRVVFAQTLMCEG